VKKLNIAFKAVLFFAILAALPVTIIGLLWWTAAFAVLAPSYILIKHVAPGAVKGLTAFRKITKTAPLFVLEGYSRFLKYLMLKCAGNSNF
jgi:hypothetical protein